VYGPTGDAPFFVPFVPAVGFFFDGVAVFFADFRAAAMSPS
jgi:hypothetical protein